MRLPTNAFQRSVTDFYMSGPTGRSTLHIRVSTRKMGGNMRIHLMIPKMRGPPSSPHSSSAF